jgi:hypothetical protein
MFYAPVREERERHIPPPFWQERRSAGINVLEICHEACPSNGIQAFMRRVLV